MAARGRGLRIVAGSFRGHRIEVAKATRPTTDRVRAAIFDSLVAPPPLRVLDCYAGSGALGLEAISRGAEFVRFIEKDPRAIAVIRSNLCRMGVEANGQIDRSDVIRADLTTDLPYGLVVADPPYADDPWALLFERLKAPGVLAADGLVVAEFSARRKFPAPPAEWLMWKTRHHGDTAFAIYRKHPGATGVDR